MMLHLGTPSLRVRLSPALAAALLGLPPGARALAQGAPGTAAGLADAWPTIAMASTPAPATFGAGVVQAARRHVGARYVLGAEGPGAFDCSSFVRWVFAERGVSMPRTAREQAGVGDAPYPGDLRPGDLLFFWGGSGAQHVAIYAGGDSIIHASIRSRRVRIDRMRGTGAQRDWFGRRLIAVRRVRPSLSATVTPAFTPSLAQAGARVAPAARTTIFAGGPR